MKKVLFLLLFLLVLGTAGTNAQVRIGGDEIPNEATILDLNANDATDTGIKGLALPRVSLVSHDDLLGYSGLLEGMLVYNTNAGMTGGDGVGVYYWDGSQWVKPAGSTTVADGSITASKLAQMGAASGQVLKWNGTAWAPAADNNDNTNTTYTGSTSITLSGTSFQRPALIGDVTAAANANATTIANNAVTTAKIADNAITSAKIADGTIATADIANNAITSAKIADGTIATADLANASVTRAKTNMTVQNVTVASPGNGNSANVLLPAGCSAQNAWVTSVGSGFLTFSMRDANFSVYQIWSDQTTLTMRVYCF